MGENKSIFNTRKKGADPFVRFRNCFCLHLSLPQTLNSWGKLSGFTSARRTVLRQSLYSERKSSYMDLMQQVWLVTVNLPSWAREYDQDRNHGDIYLRKYKVSELGKDFKIFRPKQGMVIHAWSCNSWETEAGSLWGLGNVTRPQKHKTGARHGGPCLWSLGVRGPFCLHSEVFQDIQDYVERPCLKQTKIKLGWGCRSAARVLAEHAWGGSWLWSPAPHKLAVFQIIATSAFAGVETGPSEVQGCPWLLSESKNSLGYLRSCFKNKNKLMAGEMAQWWIMLAAILEDPSSVLICHTKTWKFTTPCNYSSREADGLFWSIQCNLYTWHIHTCAHICKNKS